MAIRNFWNREEELRSIRERMRKGGFGWVVGRRRIGKTALLAHACDKLGGLYHQAVEGTPRQQIWHLVEEWKPSLPALRDVTPRTWSEFFALLAREKSPRLFVLDEFPYLVEADPALPSILQKWIDHQLPRSKTLLLVSGSSQSMLFSQFLNHSAPLYGRASLQMRLQPLTYRWFCRATGHGLKDPDSFERFALVGGVPHYWKLLPDGSTVEQADRLYFKPSAVLADEPMHMLRDEGVTGALPKTILDLAGRGVTKPGEFASRIGTLQGNLSRPLALLLELNLLTKELPFGESSRTTKKVHYSLRDSVLAFYYGTCLPHRHRWNAISAKERAILVHRHASVQWEIFCRENHPGAGRYWEGDIELDIVAPLDGNRHLVAECKWKKISSSEERSLLDDLRRRFSATKLAPRLRNVEFRIYSQRNLGELGRLTD